MHLRFTDESASGEKKNKHRTEKQRLTNCYFKLVSTLTCTAFNMTSITAVAQPYLHSHIYQQISGKCTYQPMKTMLLTHLPLWLLDFRQDNTEGLDYFKKFYCMENS